jgi:hypothetical protein
MLRVRRFHLVNPGGSRHTDQDWRAAFAVI